MQKGFSLNAVKKLRIFFMIGSLLVTPFDMDAYEIQDPSSPVAFAFDFFVHTYKVAGALGHVNNRSSLV